LLAQRGGRGDLLAVAAVAAPRTRLEPARADPGWVCCVVVRPVTADAADLSERAPRLFAIVPEDQDGEDGPVMGYGMRLADGTAAFVWTEPYGGLGLFGTVDRMLTLVCMSGPARLVWLSPAAEGV